MKTILKPLNSKYVHTYSDIKYGILGRNQAVDALKKILTTINSKKFLKQIDKLKPGKNPNESLIVFLDWLYKKYPGIYFRGEEGKYYFGYTSPDQMKRSILPFPMDFVDNLIKMDTRLGNLAIKACYAFATFHRIGEPCYGNRLYNEEYGYDSLGEYIDSGPHNPSDDAKKEYEETRKIFESYTNIRGKYEKRFMGYTHKWQDPYLIDELLAKHECDSRLQFVIDVLRKMLELCGSKTIEEYSYEGLEIFCEINEIPKDESGQFMFDDGFPLTLEDRIMFVWAGETESGYDPIFSDIEAAANSYAGEFGYTDYSIDREIHKKFELEDFMNEYKIDAAFFTALESVYNEYLAMRNEIMFGTIKDEIINERRSIRAGKRTENLQTTLFNGHVYRSA